MDRPSLFAIIALSFAGTLAWLLGPLAHIGAAYLPFVAAVIVVAASAGAGWGLLACGLGAAWPFLFTATVAPMGQDPPSPYTLALYALAALPACVVAAVARRRILRLQVERALLDHAFESVADGLITTDAGTRVLRMNRSAERLTGWRAPEARGKPLAQVLRLAGRADGPMTPAAQILTGGAFGHDAHTLFASDGSERPVVPLVYADGHGGQLVQLRDLTDWQCSERELRHQIDELRTAIRHRDQTIAALSGAADTREPPTPAVTPHAPVSVAAPPESPPEPDTQPVHVERGASADQRVLMLCADDENAFALSMLLGLAGYDVQTANSADEALRRAAHFAPQVALIDVDLVDGVGVAAALRGIAPALLLVALTRAEATSDSRRLAAAGYTMTVPKSEPLVLKRWLAGPRAA